MSRPIDLRPDHAKIVQDILSEHLPVGASVRVFGSRAKWSAKTHSDLDLALRGKDRLQLALLADLAEAFSESDLPFKVDVVDWRTVTRSFQEVIDRDGVALRLRNVAASERVATLRLGDHCEKIGSGATPRGGKETYSNEGPVSLIRSQNVLNDRFSRFGLAHISIEQAEQLRNVEVKAGDVLLNITGDSVARACQVDDGVLPARVNQHVAILRPRPEEVDPRFLRYFLVSAWMQAYMLGLASAGATRNALTKSMVEDFRVPAFPIRAQRAIGSILGALDDKIDLNRRMNETLEAMARAIFKDWFVDFGPTRAKMESRAPYLAPEIWALFPDRLDDEGKPEGWIVNTLRGLAAQSKGTIRTGPFGSQLHQSDYSLIGTPVVMPTNLTAGEITEDGIARVDAKIAARLNDHAMSNGDIVYGRRGDIGRKALVGPDQAGWLCGTGCLRISIRSKQCPPIYIFHHLDRPEVRDWIAARAIGATMPNLNTGILGEVEILVPSPEIASQYVEVVDPFLQRFRANIRENKALAATRDLLLPKLMSGEIRVRDAEKIAEAVA